MKTYLARIVVHFTAEVRAENREAAALVANRLSESIDERLGGPQCLGLANATLEGAVQETLIEGEA